MADQGAKEIPGPGSDAAILGDAPAPAAVEVPEVAPAPAAAAPAAASASALASDFTSKASETTSAIKEKMKSIGARPAGILVGLIVVALLGFAIAYGLYWMINTLVLNKRQTIIDGTKNGVTGSDYRRFDGSMVPKATNGKRISFSFWIYIHDLQKFQGTVRHVFHRGDQAIDVTSAQNGPSPYVFLDSEKNKLYILMAPIDLPATVKTAVDAMTNPQDKARYMASRYGIVVDYVPIQRWVHIGVTVNENAGGGIISAFVDGELIKTISSGSTATVGSTSVAADITRLNLDKVGDIWVGGSPSENVGPGFAGLVSKITFFNYDLNAKDMYRDYLSGPIDSMMARLGLPAYGIRTPLYRIG